jgi:hypothetical protein
MPRISLAAGATITEMHEGVLQSPLGAEHLCGMDNFHALYSGENEFKSQPRDTLSCSDFSSFPQYFLSNAEIVPQIRPRPLPLTSVYTNRLTIRRCIVSDVDTFVT